MNEIQQEFKPKVSGNGFIRYLVSIGNMLTSPKEEFRRVDEHPRVFQSILIPVVGTLLVSVANVIVGFRSPQFEEAMQKMPETMSTVMKYGAPIIGAIFGIIIMLMILLIKAGIIHVIAPFLNGKSTFKHAVSVLGYASTPGLIFGLLSLVYVFLNPNEYIPFNASLGLVFTKEKVGLLGYTFWNYIDLFTLWSLWLSIIGIAIVYKFSWKKAAVILLSLYLIGIGLGLGITKVFQPLIEKSNPMQVEDDTE
ncbi:MAG: YIP1 family protein [bacterium]|nr:YIP1 family protein [bacterium]